MRTNLLNKHDFMTLTVVDAVGLRMNMTVSRRGEKVSGSGSWDSATFKAVANGFMSYVQREGKDKSYLVVMEAVKTKATDAKDWAGFAAVL